MFPIERSLYLQTKSTPKGSGFSYQIWMKMGVYVMRLHGRLCYHGDLCLLTSSD